MRIDLDNVYMDDMPDGMPHFGLDDFANVIDARIRSAQDLIKLAMVKDILDSREHDGIYLNLLYLSAQRMDRPISSKHPFTLRVFANHINNLGFKRVKLYCPHSDVTPALIDRSYVADYITSIFVHSALVNFKRKYEISNNELCVVFPDANAYKHYKGINFGDNVSIVTASKKRDMATGKLSSFKIVDGEVRPYCFLLDDLCDGGGTFLGVHDLLTTNGCKKAALATFHAIYSRGWGPLSERFDLYCTNSYRDWQPHVTYCFPINYTNGGQ